MVKTHKKKLQRKKTLKNKISGGYKHIFKTPPNSYNHGIIYASVKASNLKNVYMFPFKNDSKYICHGYFIADITAIKNINEKSYEVNDRNYDKRDMLDEALKEYLTSEILPILNKDNKLGINITLDQIKIYDFKMLKYEKSNEEYKYTVEGHIYYEDVSKLNTQIDEKIKKNLPPEMNREIADFLLPPTPVKSTSK